MVTNVDAMGSEIVTGRELTETGLPVVIDQQPGSVVITYKKVEQP